MGRWHNAEVGETRVTVDGSPLERKLAGLAGWEPKDDAAKDAEPMARPSNAASKEQWVRYAVEGRGMDKATAEAMTRDQLADAFPAEDTS